MVLEPVCMSQGRRLVVVVHWKIHYNMAAIDEVHAYLLTRAKKSIESGDSWMAKSWLLTCSVLFPRSFSLQYDRYQIAKKERNVAEATSCLCEMLQNPEGSDYPELKQEKRLIVDVIRFDDQPVNRLCLSTASSQSNSPVASLDQESKCFLRNLFNSLSSSFKHKILMSVSKEGEGSWYDSCHLLMITLKMFPAEIEREGVRLIQQIQRAEEVDVKNSRIYQQMLIFDALPLILSSESSGTGCMIFKNTDELRTHLMTVFHFFTMKSCITDASADPREDDLIESKMTDIVMLSFKKMGWKTDLISLQTDSMDVSLIRLTNAFNELASVAPMIVKREPSNSHSDAPIDLSAPAKKQKIVHESVVSPTISPSQQQQLLLASCLMFLKCMSRYARESRQNQSALIEIVNSSAIKVKLVPHHQNGLPEILSTGQPKLRSSFLACVKCIDLIINPVIGIVHEFFAMIKTIGAEDSSSYQELRRDACFFKGQHEEFIQQTIACISMKNQAMSMKPLVQVISASLLIHDYKAAIHHAIIAVQNLSSLQASKGVDEDKDSDRLQDRQKDLPGYRVFQFLPLTQETVFNFCIDCIINCLKYTTLLSLKPSDAGIGHLLVLSQYKWPRYVDVFKSCVSAIKKPLESLPAGRSAQPQMHRFVYLPFLEYVKHPDMLEEFMALCSDERLQLELSSGASVKTANARQMTTRGVNKGAKEEVKVCLLKQMSDSQEELSHEVYTDFIVNVLRLMN